MDRPLTIESNLTKGTHFFMYAPLSHLKPEDVKPGTRVQVGLQRQPGRINYLQTNHPNEHQKITGAIVLLDTLRSASYCGARYPADQVFVYLKDLK